MSQYKIEVYLGKQFPEGFVGYFNASNFFGVISFEAGITEDAGKKMLEELRARFELATILSLKDFEDFIAKQILSLNMPLSVSLSIGYLKNKTLYLKTINEGQVYLRRNNLLKMLLQKDQVASGIVEDLDLFIFTTSKIETVIGKQDDLYSFVKNLDSQEINKQLLSEGYEEEEPGFVFYTLEFNYSEKKVLEEETIYNQKKVLDLPEATDMSHNFGGNLLGVKIVNTVKNKMFVIFAVIILGALLVWSVVFGYERRQDALVTEKIQTAKSKIEEKFQEAKQITGNTNKSLELLKQAEDVVFELKKEIDNKDKYKKSILELEESITVAKEEALKISEVKLEEYFDFKIEEKDASGVDLFIDGNLVAVLDSNLKKVYVLDIEKKSIVEYVSSSLKGSKAVSIYNKEIYFLNENEGVYKFTTQNKASLILEKSTDWGEVSDLSIYNGNIYLLDSGENDIYRYAPSNAEYKTKTSYFKSTVASNVFTMTDFDIDGSVYVLYENKLEKYLRGVNENVKFQFPEGEVSLSKVETSPEEKSLVAVLDNKNAKVYLFSKNGKYEGVLSSLKFTKNSNIFFYDSTLFLLSGSTIYKIEK